MTDVLRVCTKWNICGKVVKVCTDNAKNMAKACMAKVLTESGNAPAGTVAVPPGYSEEGEGGEDDDDAESPVYESAADFFLEEMVEIEEVPDEVIDAAMVSLAAHLDAANPSGLVTQLRGEGLLPLWGPCSCHLLQLAVKDFLAMRDPQRETIGACIQPISDWVGCARRSGHVAAELRKHDLVLAVANKTRWSSKLEMVNSVINIRSKVPLRMFPVLAEPPPNSDTMEDAEEICEVLQVAKAATKTLEGDYVSMGCVLSTMAECERVLGEMHTQYALTAPRREFLADRLKAAIQNR
eukprot:GHVU01232588.1.p1 GENE.GHVU01232588.1~~GHVU01232588.1.p1  ORF type:complete len:319 (+),score=42.62 GHVU01232588.1:70-957(+)